MTTEITRFLDRRGSRRAFVGSLGAMSLSTVGLRTAGGAVEAAVAGAPTKSQPAKHSTYLFAHITLKPGTLEALTEVLRDVAPLFEKHGGWKLQGCHLQADGAENTVIDVWKVANADAVQTSLATAAKTLHSRDHSRAYRTVWQARRFRS